MNNSGYTGLSRDCFVEASPNTSSKSPLESLAIVNGQCMKI